MDDWPRRFFVDKSEMFLIRMNAMWKFAEEDARGIANIIKKYMPNGIRVLDLMCGNGRIAIHLAKLGFNVVGLDFSERFIADAREKARVFGVEKNVEFVVGDARRVDEYFGEEFDAVLIFWSSIGYYDEDTDKEIFRRVYKITRPGGLFMILNTVSLELYASYYRKNVVEFFGEDIFIDINEFDVETATLRAKWRWYRRDGENLKFMDEIELRLRIYAKHEIVRMFREAGWEVVDMLHSHKTLEKARINSPINIVARKRVE